MIATTTRNAFPEMLIADREEGKILSLFYQGHVYDDAGEADCQMPGHEDCTIGTDVDGVPAWWQNGHLYVLNKLVSCLTGNKFNDWADKR